MERRGLQKVWEEGRVVFTKMTSQYQDVYLPMVRGKPWVGLYTVSTTMAMMEHHFSLTGGWHGQINEPVSVAHKIFLVMSVIRCN